MSSKVKSSAATGGGAALVPKLRFPEFWDAGSWIPRRLGRFLSESRLPGSKGDVAKKITVRLWASGVFAKNEAVQGSANTQYFQRKAGQLIYSKLDFLNQAFGIIPDELDGFESTADLPCFDISVDLNAAFILECVKRKDFYLRVGEAADGSRIAKRIHPETFLASEIPLPSLSEQQKIADCLASVDALITAQGRKVEALKAHKKGLIEQLFSQEGETRPRLRFLEFRDALPWKTYTLESQCTAKISYGIVQAGPNVPDGMPYIKSTDLSSELRLAKLSRTSDEIARKYRRSEVLPGDLVFSLRGNIGVSQIVPEEIPVANLTQGTARIRTRGPSAFYLAAFQSQPVRVRILAVSKGSTFQEISLEALREISLCCPGLDEQQRIADCLTSLDDLIAAESQKLDTFKTHKKGLIQQLFPFVEEDDA